ncbi:MAG: 2-oxo acid dehydrogenase subunit E2 [Deltaproteobacteria bacterium]|nr:2-oxo acid dehydrogenase subunit E2 [Deltaproteobacteria bacterium]
MNPIEDLEGYVGKRRAFINAFSWRNIGPTAHCNVDCDMTTATAYRKNFNEERPEAKLTFNDMIIKAAANALSNHRLYTCAYNGRHGLFPADTIDIRFPVDLGDYLGWGMVKNADRKTLAEIAADARAAIERTRRETPKRTETWARIARQYPPVPAVLKGVGFGLRLAGICFPDLDRWFRTKARSYRGTFLITNVGPAGIMRMEGPIVTPDILHLMITATRKTPVLVEGRVETRPMMPLVAKFDVRMTDAGQAAAFLTDVKRNLEDPDHRLGPY